MSLAVIVVRNGNTYTATEADGRWHIRNARNNSYVGNVEKFSQTQYLFRGADGSSFGVESKRSDRPIDVITKALAIHYGNEINTYRE